MILPVIRQGKTATIVWQLSNPVPPPAVLYDPPTPPLITILDPNNTQQVIAQPMTKISTGVYRYDYQTPVTGQTGTWSCWVDATDSTGLSSGSAYQGIIPAKATPAFNLI